MIKKITAILCGVLVIGVPLYDLIAYLISGSDATISMLVWKLIDQSSSFTFAAGLLIGILLGHLFFPRKIYQ